MPTRNSQLETRSETHDGNARTVALGEVDVVKAGAGANDKSQRREVVEGVGGDGRGANADESVYEGGLRRGQWVEKAEVGGQAVLEWKFEWREVVYKDERTVVFDFIVFCSHWWINDGSKKMRLGSKETEKREIENKGKKCFQWDPFVLKNYKIAIGNWVMETKTELWCQTHLSTVGPTYFELWVMETELWVMEIINPNSLLVLKKI